MQQKEKKRVGDVAVNSLKTRGSRQNSNSEYSLLQNSENVNTNLQSNANTDERLADAVPSNESLIEDPTTGPEPDGAEITVAYLNGKTPPTKTQRAIGEIAQKLGIRITFAEFYNADGSKVDNVNGFVTGDGRIVANVFSKRIVEFIFKHELTHTLEKSEGYMAFRQAVFNSEVFKQWAKEKANVESSYEALEILVDRAVNSRKGVSIKGADETAIFENDVDGKAEVLADFIGENCFGMDEETSLKALRTLAESNRNIFIKLADAVGRLLDKLRGTQYAMSLRQIERRFRRVLNKKTVSDDIKGNFEKTSLSKNNLERKNKTGYNEFNTLAMSWANSVGVKQGSINTLYDGRIGKWCLIIADKDSTGGYKILKKGTREEVKTYEQQFNASNGEEYGAFDRYAEIYEPGENGHSNNLRQHTDGGVHGRDSILFDGQSGQTERNASSGNTESLRLDTAKAPGNLTAEAGSNESAFSNGKNIKLSVNTLTRSDSGYLQAVDDGDTESAQQMVDEAAEQSMPGSKVRDANGKLLKVYHGTESEETFYVFDKKRRGQTDSGTFGLGFYFTSDYDYAEMFTEENPNNEPRAFYLNITNPFTVSKINAPAKEIADKLIAHGIPIDIDYSSLEAYQFAKAFGNKKFSETLISLGYDGVVVKDGFECVAYDQEQMKSADPVTYDDNGNVIPLSQRFDLKKNDIRFSIEDDPNKSSTTYDKPITIGDIQLLREIINAHTEDRVSINDFTSEDIQKAQKWAYKFYNELGNKSPFFRTWFGDWRAHENKPIENIIVTSNVKSFTSANEGSTYIKNGIKNKTLFRGDTINQDTKFKINVGAQVYNDTLTYANRELSRDSNKSKSDLLVKYNDTVSILEKIKQVCEDSVLLDTVLANAEDDSDQSFFHHFYCLSNVDGRAYLVNLTVDELNSMHGDIRRAYNVDTIRITPVAVSQVYKPAFTTSVNGSLTSVNTIANLYNFVKTYDKDFHPGKPVNPALLNEDGTPKAFYHQTENDFTVFDIGREGAGTRDNETPFGIFLKSTDKDIGLRGKKQMPLYVQARSPLTVSNRSELVQNLKAMSPVYAELSEKSKAIDREYSRREEKATQDFKNYVARNAQSENRKNRQEMYADPEFQKVLDAEDRVVEEWTEKAAENDLAMKREIEKVLRDNGYDSVILKEDSGSFGRITDAVIVLDNTQVKSATDNIGTFDSNNPDIRFSTEDDINESSTTYTAEEIRNKYENGEMSSDEARDALAKLYGVIPPGEIPSRDINVPYKTSENMHTRRFVRTVLESQHLTDEQVSNVSEDIVKEVLSYVPVGNEQANKVAVFAVENGTAEKKWNKIINSRFT